MRDYPNEKPQTRGECDFPRPCPFMSCGYHLLWIKYPKWRINGLIEKTDEQVVKEICTMKESCALDLADRGGSTLEEVGEAIGTTRERVRQILGDGKGSRQRIGMKKMRNPRGKRMIDEVKKLKANYGDL